MSTVVALTGGLAFTASQASAATGDIRSPFPVGERWYVYQGYNSGTHAGGYGLDLTLSTSTTSTSGRTVVAPASGTILYYQSAYGNVCVNTQDGRSYTLTHINPSVTSGSVTAGQTMGTVAPAGQKNNNNVAHLHFGYWQGPGCYGQSPEIPLDSSHRARMCGAPDMTPSGPSTGNGTWSGTYITAATCGSTPSPTTDSLTLGSTSTATGDFNGDGFEDLALGVPGEDLSGGVDAGGVYIAYGSSSGFVRGPTVSQSEAGSTSGLLNGSQEAGDHVGASVASGDFNNDGYDDLAIGAPGEGLSGGEDAGGVYVAHGSSSGFTRGPTLAQSTPGASNGLINGAQEAGDYVGTSVTTGDFNGDGYDDVAVGAIGEDLTGGSNAGGVYVANGAASGFTRGATIAQSSPGTDNGLINGAQEKGDYVGGGFPYRRWW